MDNSTPPDLPITPQQLKDEVLDLMEGNLTAEEERDRDQILTGDDELLDYFLLRCALRRCIRMDLEIARINDNSWPPAHA